MGGISDVAYGLFVGGTNDTHICKQFTVNVSSVMGP